MNKLRINAPEIIFVLIALIFGLLFVFITPPFQSPDENSHFLKAYSISKGNIFPVIKNGESGNYFPKNYLAYIDIKTNYSTKLDKKYSYGEIYADQVMDTNNNGLQFRSYSTKDFSFVFYLVPTFGILVGNIVMKLFNVSPSPAFLLYFARFASLLFSIFVIYKAIKITPVLKKTISVICLIPMVLFLFSMVSYDNLIIPLSILGISIMLKLMFDEKYKLNNKNIILLLLIAFVLLNIKIIYSFIFVMLLFIPREKFGLRHRKILCILLFFLSTVLLTTIFKIPTIIINSKVTATNSPSLLPYLLKHPFEYIKILFKNIINNRLFLLCSTIGVLGLLDVYLPIMLIFFYYIYLPVLFLSDGNMVKIDNKLKLLILICCIGSIGAIFTIMYISWTPYLNGINATHTISGVQGRYFLPLIFPFALIFTNNIPKNKFFDWIKNNYLLYPILCLIITTFMLIARYWF